MVTRVKGSVSGKDTVKRFATVAAAQAAATLQVGDVIQIDERASALFDVIAPTTNNGQNIIDGTASSVSMQLRVDSRVNLKSLGPNADAATDDTAFLDKAHDIGNNVFIPSDTYVIRDFALRTGKIIEGEASLTTTLTTGNNTSDGIVIDASARNTGIKNLTLSASSVGASNVGIESTATGAPNHNFENVTVNNFFQGFNFGNGFFSNCLKNIRANTCGTSFVIDSAAGTAIEMHFDSLYSSQPTTLGLDIAGAKGITINNFNSGSAGAPHLDVRLNSVGIVFNAPNFEQDTGTIASGSQCLLFQSTTDTVLNGPTFAAPSSADATAFLIRAKNNAVVYVNAPKVLNRGANIRDIFVEDNATVYLFDPRDELTDNSINGNGRIIKLHEQVDASPIRTGLASVSDGSIVATGLSPRPDFLHVEEVIPNTNPATYTKAFHCTFYASNGNCTIRVYNTTTGAVDSGGPWKVRWFAYYDAPDLFGTHTGANNAATLTDSTKNWPTNSLIGLTLTNTTDGSSGSITANTATTITVTLSGGTDNDFDTGDAYTIS